MSDDVEVIRDEAGEESGALVLRVAGHEAGRLDYRTTPEEIVIDYVEVDPSRRGRGLGVHLVDAAAAWARDTGRTLRPLCGYAALVIRRNPAYQDLVSRRD